MTNIQNVSNSNIYTNYQSKSSKIQPSEVQTESKGSHELDELINNDAGLKALYEKMVEKSEQHSDDEKFHLGLLYTVLMQMTQVLYQVSQSEALYLSNKAKEIEAYTIRIGNLSSILTDGQGIYDTTKPKDPKDLNKKYSDEEKNQMRQDRANLNQKMSNMAQREQGKQGIVQDDSKASQSRMSNYSQAPATLSDFLHTILDTTKNIGSRILS